MSSWSNKNIKKPKFINIQNPAQSISENIIYKEVNTEPLKEHNLKQTINFITYGDSKYEPALERIKKEVIDTSWFDTISIYRPTNLTIEFRNKFNHILNQPRGGGYWIWKVDIIKQHLNKINDNDILIYCDSGCSINKLANTRFFEYINMLNNSEFGIISFQTEHIEKFWTTNEIFNYFKINDDEILESGIYVGGILVMKKNNHLIEIIDEFYRTLEYNAELVTDKYNSHQANYFRDNRHDQSVFSIIRKIYGSIVIKDETFFQPWGSNESLKYPFWATRKN